MTRSERNDFFYVCSMIEYTARKTKNRRRVIVEKLQEKGIRKQLQDAQVNHSLSFEQVSDEWVEIYGISEGDFDTISGCSYRVPTYTEIGNLYCILIERCAKAGQEIEELIKLFSSFISDEISNFKTDLYYQNPDYLKCSYQEGRLLE